LSRVSKLLAAAAARSPPELPATAAAPIHSPALSLALLLAGAMSSTSSLSRGAAALLLMLQPRLHTRWAIRSAAAALEARKSPTGLHADSDNNGKEHQGMPATS
jgi:hypothetical protein